MQTTTLLSGPIHTWSVNGRKREYLVTTLAFGAVRGCLEAHTFDPETGEGEQRQQKDGHIRLLRAEMEAGNFTPAPISAGLRPAHRAGVTRVGEEVEIAVSSGSPLPLTDGLQRTAALNQLLAEARRVGDATKESEILAVPVTVVVHLDGDTQLDFINLNQGKSVDATHLFSLRLRKDVGQKSNPAIRLADGAAKLLHRNPDSPYFNALRFADTPGMAPVPVKTLCATGASEVGTSLVGVATVRGSSEADVASLVVDVYQALKAGAPDLLGVGRLLAPPLPHGTRGSATMLAGVATCVAYYRSAKGVQAVSADETHSLLRAAATALSEKVAGNFSAQRKRELLGLFARQFFSGMGEECHSGVPVGLLRMLSCSAFGVPPLPRVKQVASKPTPPNTVRKPQKKSEAAEATPALNA